MWLATVSIVVSFITKNALSLAKFVWDFLYLNRKICLFRYQIFTKRANIFESGPMPTPWKQEIEIGKKEFTEELDLCPSHSPYLSALDFWHFEFDKLDIFSSSNWIFAGYTGSKNQVQNRQKIKFVELNFSNYLEI